MDLLKRNKPAWMRSCIISSVITLGGGCIGGVQFPQADAERYLREQGMSKDGAERITHLNPLTQDEYTKYSNSNNSDIRYTIALNPHTPEAVLMQLSKDRNMTVRQGLAANKKLPANLATELSKDTKRVLQTLVGNPSVPEETLLDIFDNKNIAPYWFARNPNCPERIRQYIQTQGDDITRRTLKEKYKRLPGSK